MQYVICIVFFGRDFRYNTTAVFLHDVMVPENDFLKRGSAVGVFSWVTLSSDYRFELEVEWIIASR